MSGRIQVEEELAIAAVGGCGRSLCEAQNSLLRSEIDRSQPEIRASHQRRYADFSGLMTPAARL
jgi:hypothetical protein